MRARFHRADNLHPPELWNDVLERAAAAPSRAPAWPRVSPGFRLILLFVALLVLAAAIAAVGALLRTPRPVSPESGWIAWELLDSVQAGPGYISLTSVDGATEVIVGADADGLEQGCPAFSADGSLLAYAERVNDYKGGSYPTGDETDATVVVLALDPAGQPVERLRASAGRTDALPCPAWAPDGSAVAFIGDGRELQVAWLDGATADLGVVDARSFSWIYDSSAIVVIDAAQQVRIVPTDDTEPLVLAGAQSIGGSTEHLHEVAASPTGPLVAIAGSWVPTEDPDATPPDQGFVRVVSYPNARVILEQEELGWGLQPAWSPDGTRLAWHFDDGVFVRAIDEPAAIVQRGPWVMPGVPYEVRVAIGVSWSRDATRVLFLGYSDGRDGQFLAFVSIAAEGPADPVALSSWTGEMLWATPRGVTWQGMNQ